LKIRKINIDIKTGKFTDGGCVEMTKHQEKAWLKFEKEYLK